MSLLVCTSEKVWLGRHRESQASVCVSCDVQPNYMWGGVIRRLSPCIFFFFFLPEHGDEQVDKQDVGDQQINDQQDYHQPVTVLYSAWFLAVLNQRHVVGAVHVPLFPHWNGAQKYSEDQTSDLTMKVKKLRWNYCDEFLKSWSHTGYRGDIIPTPL